MQDFRRDELGRLNFHEVQEFLYKYREDRVLNFKKVYPNLTSTVIAHATPPSTLTGGNPGMVQPKNVVSTAVAPTTMFLRAKGNTNADLIEKVKNSVLESPYPNYSRY